MEKVAFEASGTLEEVPLHTKDGKDITKYVFTCSKGKKYSTFSSKVKDYISKTTKVTCEVDDEKYGERRIKSVEGLVSNKDRQEAGREKVEKMREERKGQRH